MAQATTAEGEMRSKFEAKAEEAAKCSALRCEVSNLQEEERSALERMNSSELLISELRDAQLRMRIELQNKIEEVTDFSTTHDALSSELLEARLEVRRACECAAATEHTLSELWHAEACVRAECQEKSAEVANLHRAIAQAGDRTVGAERLAAESSDAVAEVHVELQRKSAVTELLNEEMAHAREEVKCARNCTSVAENEALQLRTADAEARVQLEARSQELASWMKTCNELQADVSKLTCGEAEVGAVLATTEQAGVEWREAEAQAYLDIADLEERCAALEALSEKIKQ